MNLISQLDGLPARQRAIDQLKQVGFVINNILKGSVIYALAIILLLTSGSCKEKIDGKNSAELKKHPSSIKRDSLDKPQVNIKVNRHYDEKGNLLGFDSTYSSYYSNIKGDTSKMDSLIHGFDRYFNNEHSLSFDKRFNTLFFNDSLRYPDFFHNDFFMKRYELNDAYMRDMMKKMDSIKNNFYYNQSKANKKS